MTAPLARYQQLDAGHILATLERLQARIAERFPGSGLSKVATDLISIGREAEALAGFLGRPVWPIRIIGGVAIVFLLAVVLLVISAMRLPAGVNGMADFLQATESLINDLVFMGIAVYFMLTLENRFKRRRALDSLHRLRSISHIVDMHQLTKDPEMLQPHPDTAASGDRPMSPAALGRYLDYCSELLSLTAKLAALHIQDFNDAVVLGAVNEIETLTSGLSGKIWQKITLLERTGT
jgi:hypothetical protein